MLLHVTAFDKKRMKYYSNHRPTLNHSTFCLIAEDLDDWTNGQCFRKTNFPYHGVQYFFELCIQCGIVVEITRVLDGKIGVKTVTWTVNGDDGEGDDEQVGPVMPSSNL